MKPTIRTIANDLGVSPATVSKALSGRPEVNEETRVRIADHARSVGYFAAKAVAASARIGLLICGEEGDLSSGAFGYDIMLGFQQQAGQYGFEVVILTIGGEEQERESLESFAEARQLKGLFISGLKTTDSFYRQLETTTLPCVLLDIRMDNPWVGEVGANSISGARLAVDHLVGLGHRRIGFVNGHAEAYVSRERLTGYMAAICHNGLTYNPALVFDGGFSEEGGAGAAEYFRETDVTALFFASDLMAFGAVRRLRELGVRLPEELSIVGFDNQIFCTGCMPALSTVAQDRLKLGVTACALLEGLINGSPINHVVIEPELIVRESTAPPLRQNGNGGRWE